MPDQHRFVENTLAVLAARPDAEAVVQGPRRITAGEFRALVLRTARALRRRGLRRGDGVALLGRNSPEVIAVRYAAHLLGCRVGHLSTGLTAKALAAGVEDIGARVLIADPASAGLVAAAPDLADVPDVLALGPGGHGDDLLALAARESADPVESPTAPDDPCAIHHTGGTTGPPKGICRTYGQIGGIIAAPLPPTLAEVPDGERLLVCTTLTMFGGFLADRVLARGGTVVLQDGFDAAAVLDAVEKERVTRLFLPPPLLYALIDHPAVGDHDLSGLRVLLYGASPASPARLADALRMLGPVLVQHYGQNEAGSISLLAAADHDPARPELLRSVGRPLPGVSVEIRDPAGRVLPTGRVGEIWVRSPGLMSGYWKRPDLTAEALRDGWLRTGDLGRFGPTGLLTLTDRVKDVIVVDTVNVYTTEIEHTLDAHPEVLHSAVYGVPDADGVEEVHATVVRVPGAAVDAEALRAWARREQSSVYRLARVAFTDRLPLTEGGKPDKRLLRRLTGTPAGSLPGTPATSLPGDRT
ncbi:AMP-binding protein [Streptomyces uncialis]|uniref:AMP-binding protein n=1 Tax=Streptomyces uncialis TaxID=1048205 RepID=UPI00378B7529